MKAEDEMGPTGYVTERHTRCVVARDFFARDETSSASKKKKNSFGRDPSPPPTAATPADPHMDSLNDNLNTISYPTLLYYPTTPRARRLS